jgi:hypothetical protein
MAMKLQVLALLSLLAAGCVLQGGGATARTLHPRGADRFSYDAQLQTRLAIGVRRFPVPIRAGLELDGRAEAKQGALALWGFQLGSAISLGKRVGLEPYLDVGWPAGRNSPVTGFYAGGTLELPILLGHVGSPSEINKNYRFADQRAALVPFLRVRHYQLDTLGTRELPGDELAVGLAMRIVLDTDIIDFDHL